MQPRFIALTPLLIFLAIFVGSGVYFSYQNVPFAFYQISPTVAIFPAIMWALWLGRRQVNQTLSQFVQGVRDENIIIMCLIYLLAGAFTELTKSIGSVEATVNFGLSYVPQQLLLPGLFLISSIVATAMGTSMGTIATVTPIAVGIADQAQLSCAWGVGAVISGAMFGDNLSLVSDTTIAAVQTQGAKMREKFILNAYFALVAMVITVILYWWIGGCPQSVVIKPYQIIFLTPYLLILVLALTGMNVFLVLLSGCLLAVALGFWMVPDYTFVRVSKEVTAGFQSMQEILILSLLIGGISFLSHEQGGLRWLILRIERLSNLVKSKRYGRRLGEISITLLASFADFCTANNTVAIILSGRIAAELSEKHRISPERSACLLDIASCVIQGILPYSAQLLLASKIANLSPLSLVPTVLYCGILGLVLIFGIITGWPRFALHRQAAS